MGCYRDQRPYQSPYGHRGLIRSALLVLQGLHRGQRGLYLSQIAFCRIRALVARLYLGEELPLLLEKVGPVHLWTQCQTPLAGDIARTRARRPYLRSMASHTPQASAPLLGPAIKPRRLPDVFLRLLRGGVTGSAEALQVACVPKEFRVPAMRDDMVRNCREVDAADILTEAAKRMVRELARADFPPARGVVARVTQTLPPRFRMLNGGRLATRRTAASRSIQPARQRRRSREAAGGYGHWASRSPDAWAL